MNPNKLKESWQTLEGETFKSGVELALHGLARVNAAGLLRRYPRTFDERLVSEVGGLIFENPVGVGAGWDKTGKAVDGLHELGYSHVEVGTVPLLGQYGKPKPRLFYKNGVALNRMGFNSPGAVEVEDNLSRQERIGVVGLSLGINKDTPPDEAPEQLARTAKILGPLVDYLVLNFATPNTPGSREMLLAQLRESIRQVKAATADLGLPVWVKLSPDMTDEEVLMAMAIADEEDAAGLIDSNTTTNQEIKAKYGWAGEDGGLSGDDPHYRFMCNERMKFITREARGTSLGRIGVGAINSPETALDRIMAGAQLVQVVTAMRQTRLQAAQIINRGLANYLYKEGIKNISEIVGSQAGL